MSMDPRGRRSFHDELEALQGTLLKMAGIVERLVGEAATAVLRKDAAVAERIIEEDDRVDELEIEIDERVMELLALQQPMASVLRQIIAINKVSNDLERVGDHAVNIAKAARRLADTQPLPEIRELSEMVEITREMHDRQVSRLRALRERRDETAVNEALRSLIKVARRQVKLAQGLSGKDGCWQTNCLLQNLQGGKGLGR